MLPDQVSNPGPLTYESCALPIALSGRIVLEKLDLNLTKVYAGDAGKAINMSRFCFPGKTKTT